MTGPKQVIIHASLTSAQRAEIAKILDRLVGTPIERTGDIAVEVGDKRYVFSHQDGAHTAATVERNGGIEVVLSKRAYRPTVARQVAVEGVAKVPTKAQGEEFTLKALSANWDELTETEQRNAGKKFRQLMETEFPGEFDSWTTTDNQRHYRRL